jgi:hypothetical protein
MPFRIRPSATSSLLVLALVSGAACTSGGASQGREGDAARPKRPAADPADEMPFDPRDEGAPPPVTARERARQRSREQARRDAPADERAEPRGAGERRDRRGGADRPRAAPVTVTWEALAAEREQSENPRFGKRPTQALASQKIILVNESHPDSVRAQCGKTSATKDGVSVAVVSDRDMDILLRGFEQAGFFRHARPTDGMSAVIERSEARGRVTVERGGDSVSIVSLKGQGLNQGTKEIPKLYSQLKQAIAAVRNQTPTLNIRAMNVSGTAPTR